MSECPPPTPYLCCFHLTQSGHCGPQVAHGRVAEREGGEAGTAVECGFRQK